MAFHPFMALEELLDARETPLLPLAPSPDGRAITLTIECRVTPEERRGHRHRATLGEDWSLITPHDLDAERVAVGLGGYCDCVALIEHAIPAAQEWLALHARRQLPSVTFNGSLGWLVERAPECCCMLGPEAGRPSHAFRWVEDAVAHLASTEHLAAKHHAFLRHLEPLVQAIAEVWRKQGSQPPIGHADVAARIREPDGLQQLWIAGVHPDLARRLAAQVPEVVGRLPVSYFIGMAYAKSDRRNGALLKRQTDPDVASWLVWSDEVGDAGRPIEYAAWLGLRLGPSQARDLIGAGVTDEMAEQLAASLDISPVSAASVLHKWVALDCRPTVGQLVELGLSIAPPEVQELDLVCSWLARRCLDVKMSRSELALLLALAGRIEPAMDAIQDGIRTIDAFQHWKQTRRVH